MKKGGSVCYAMLTKLVEEEGFKSPSTPVITQKYIFSQPYVNFLHMAGLDVYPIPTTASREEIRAILSKVNGVLLPGGMSNVVKETGDLTNPIVFSEYTKAVKLIMQEAIDINRSGTYFPVFGICLGFEAMIAVAANDLSIIEKCEKCVNYNATLEYTIDPEKSKLYSGLPKDIIEHMATVKSTHNFHSYMVDAKKFAKIPELTSMYKITSMSKSKDDSFDFISSIEAIDYPFYAIQYHPEIGLRTYVSRSLLVYNDYNMAAASALAMMNFLREEGKKNLHSLSEDDLKSVVANKPGTVLIDVHGISYHSWDINMN